MCQKLNFVWNGIFHRLCRCRFGFFCTDCNGNFYYALMSNEVVGNGKDAQWFARMTMKQNQAGKSIFYSNRGVGHSFWQFVGSFEQFSEIFRPIFKLDFPLDSKKLCLKKFIFWKFSINCWKEWPPPWFRFYSFASSKDAACFCVFF